MKRLTALALVTIAAPALAQHQGHDVQPDAHADRPVEQPDDPHAGHAGTDPADPHAGHAVPEPADAHSGHAMPGEAGSGLPQSGPPPEAFDGPEHAADALFPGEDMAAAREQLRREQGGATLAFVGFDRLEAQLGEGADAYLWEANAWYGGDIDKLWIKSEGEGGFGGELEEAEIQALWSHAIDPWFDVQAGIRYDVRPEPDRAHAVIGIQGLAPYFFELDAAAFLSDEGELTARFEAEYDQRITQRLIAQPRVELNFSAQDIPELGLGSGMTSVEAGLRLRYEIVPEFAPYLGVEWQRRFGDTAAFARAAGEEVDHVVLLGGVRFWF